MQITIQTKDYIYTSTLQATEEQGAVTKSSSSKDPLKSVEKFQKLLEKKRAALFPAADQAGSGNQAGAIGLQKVNTMDASQVKQATDASSATIQVPQQLEPLFRKAAQKYGVDEKLLVAIAYHESRFSTTATSKSGAMGLMQLMPKTAQGLGVTNAYDPQENIMGGAKLLSSLLKEFNGNLDYALAAYSNGSSTVRKYGGVPPIRQAQEFVSYINRVYPDGVSLG